MQAKVAQCPVTWASESFSPSEEQEGPLDPENLRRECSTLQGRSSIPAPCPPLELEAQPSPLQVSGLPSWEGNLWRLWWEIGVHKTLRTISWTHVT